MPGDRKVGTHKQCRKCGEVKPRTAFSRVTGLPNAVQYACKACTAAIARTRYAEAPKSYTAAINRRSKLKRTYGITAAQFDEMLAKQGNRCAICGTDDPPGRWKRFHVDHCHLSGRIRGLLCHMCNIGIGSLKDDPKLLSKAIDYLNRHIGG